MKEIFERYVGEQIGVNCCEPKKYSPATLTAAHDDYFTIQHPSNGLSYSYPYRWVLNVAEGEGGVQAGGLFAKHNYAVVVEVFHLVVYTGATGGGIGFGVAF